MATCQWHQHAVAHAGRETRQPGGDQPEHDQHAHTCRGQTDGRVQVLEPPHARGAADGATDRAETADRRHREDLHRLHGLVRAHPSTVQHQHVQTAGEARQEAREHEAAQRHPSGRHRARLGGLGVVARCDQQPTRTRPPDTSGQHDAEPQHGQAQPQHVSLVLQVEPGPQQGAGHVLGDERRDDVGVQHVAVEDDGERKGDHRQERPAYAQGGDAQQQRSERTGCCGDRQGHEQVDVPTAHQVARDDRTDTDQCELSQADLSAPPGEDHQADSDQSPDGHDRQRVRRARSDEQGHDSGCADEQHQAGSPGHTHRSEARDGRCDRSDQLGVTPTAVGIVRPRGGAPLQQQCADDDREQDHIDQLGTGRVPAHHLIDHSQHHGGHERDRHRLHAGDDRGGERGEEHRRPRDRRGGGTQERRSQDEGQRGQRAGQDPDEGGQTAHRYAQQPGAVGVLRRRSDGGTGQGPA